MIRNVRACGFRNSGLGFRELRVEELGFGENCVDER